jgi:hypothetical protein
VAFGVYVAGGVSGAHINPAVTLALAVKRAFPWPKVVPYWAAQVLVAFVGGALVYLVYRDAISSFEAAKHITRGALGGAADSTPTFSIFATFPAPYFGSSMVGPLIDQIVGTAFLLMFVLALTDERNQPPKGEPGPLLIGLAVAAIGMSFGPTPATPSTRPATSAPGSSPRWPAGARSPSPGPTPGRPGPSYLDDGAPVPGQHAAQGGLGAGCHAEVGDLGDPANSSGSNLAKGANTEVMASLTQTSSTPSRPTAQSAGRWRSSSRRASFGRTGSEHLYVAIR